MLFLSSFDSQTNFRRQGTLPSETIAEVCDAIRVELENKNLKKYVSSILTAHVVKRPPAHEAGLSLLLRLRGKFERLRHHFLS